MKALISSLILIFIFSTTSFSQDKIFLKSGEEFKAFILEKSEKKIRYKIMDSPDSPIIILRTEKVEKIVFRNGQKIDFPDLIRMNKRFGVNGGLLFGLGIESVFYKLRADYFITAGFSLELAGLVEAEGGSALELGAKYYFGPYHPSKLKGYAGLSVGAFRQGFFTQVPFGIHYVSKKGFDLKVGLSGQYIPSNSSINLHSDLTLGWRF
jgi:hypothetical protein